MLASDRAPLWLGLALLAGTMGVVGITGVAAAEDRKPNWPSSEFHRKLDGNGNVIPCRCLFRDKSHPLGTTVCMNTHKGTVLAQCDLVQNNTSWVPTDEPCTVSALPQRRDFAVARLPPDYPLNKRGLSAN